MLLELVTCLIAAPTACVVETVPVIDAETPIGCALMAPPVIARWAADHPARRVVRWTCRPADERRT